MTKKIRGGIEYEYTKEQIKRYKSLSTKAKLRWLEEINNLTSSVLTNKQKVFREKIRKGLL